MGRATVRAAVLVPALGFLLFPSVSRSQRADEDAALILYQSGRDRFKAGDLEEALKDLEKAWGLAPNLFIRFYLALTYTGLGRCAEAVPHLEEMGGSLRGDQETARRDALSRCRIRQAREAAQMGDCEKSARLLQGLPEPLPEDLKTQRDDLTGRCEVDRAVARAQKGRCEEVLPELEAIPAEGLPPDVAEKRGEWLRRCQQEVVGFEPVTAAQKAAAVLVREGLARKALGREAEAAVRFEKALKLYDHPHVRVLAARARVSSGACKEGLAHAEVARREALPGIEGEIEELRAWCDTFAVPPDAPLAPDLRRSLQARYREALEQGEEGLDALEATLSVYDQPRIRLFLARRRADQGRWSDIPRLLGTVPGSLPPDREQEVADLLEIARFAERDGNAEPDKRKVHGEWKRARELLGSGQWDQAEVVLRSIQANPLVARELAVLAVRRGDCEEVRVRIGQAAQGLTLGEDWVREQLGQCTRIAQENQQERQRLALEETRRQRIQRARTLRTASYALWGLTAAAAGAGGYFAWAWTDARSRSLDRMREYDRATSQEEAEKARNAVESARSSQRLQAILGGVSGAVALGCAAGAIVTLVQARDLEAPVRIGIVPMGSVGSMGALVVGTF